MGEGREREREREIHTETESLVFYLRPCGWHMHGICKLIHTMQAMLVTLLSTMGPLSVLVGLLKT